ncbi:DegV family protein [Chengkuizengella axinellae]|uniref:DegV family protein n=1 Tax=Chengkuizengella axinellae TaxID=3064388 RepID=A0ABT9IVJ5_9BACL|nr:DegV family protein [Chengkuizengella sp. 2205SS18-9]MDP5273376.1 DegV family protein [Chengkuizengella sp. 2205SS18-9]
MSNIRFVTDSTSDIPLEIREKYNIEMVPLKVHFGEEVFLDAITIQSKEFYEKLAVSDVLPTTSQPSPVDFLNVYKKIYKEDPDCTIISIHLSSAMSGTYQSAVLAKSLLDEEADLHIIDSKSASFGNGILMVEAIKAYENGKNVEEILEVVAKLRQDMRVYFLVDTLEYLQKGGRIGKAASLIGSLLNIKPILSIDDEGEITSVDKVRGKKKAIHRIVDLLKEDFEKRDVDIVVVHSNDLSSAESFADFLKEQFQVHNVKFTSLSPVVGTHVGPGTLAVIMRPI